MPLLNEDQLCGSRELLGKLSRKEWNSQPSTEGHICFQLPYAWDKAIIGFPASYLLWSITGLLKFGDTRCNVALQVANLFSVYDSIFISTLFDDNSLTYFTVRSTVCVRTQTCIAKLCSEACTIVEAWGTHTGTVIYMNKQVDKHVKYTRGQNFYSKLYVTQCQLMRLFAVKLILSYEQKCKVGSKFLKN